MKLRVLIMGPWAITRPRHGGQIRAASIVDAYRERGHSAMFIGIFDPGNIPLADTGPNDIGIDSSVMSYIAQSGEPWEISLWEAFSKVPELLSRFREAINRFQPDVLQFEEPYLWPVVRTLRKHGVLDGVFIVHSSYNFESQYRRDLARIANSVDERVLAYVVCQENEIARESDLIIVVSDADAASFRSIGAQKVVVARNGSRPPEPTPAALTALNAYLGDTPFALFVSSAHPPNAQGLLEFAAAAEERLPGLLVVCGSVYKLLESSRNSHRLIRDAKMTGTVDLDVLDALLLRASVILLPKTSGGGSNLKTSEALLANRPVVATTMAFAGFESWRNLPGVAIADEPDLFWQLTATALADSKMIVDSTKFDRRDDLHWHACLAPMVESTEALVSSC